MRHVKVAIILLVDEQNRFLLQHRTKDARTAPDYWAFFGGGIRPHETPLEAAIRESQEELSHRPQNPVEVHERDFLLPNLTGHMHVFVDRYQGDKGQLQLGEGQNWGWFSLQESQPLKMLDHDREVLEVVLASLQNVP